MIGAARRISHRSGHMLGPFKRISTRGTDLVLIVRVPCPSA